MDNNKSIGIIGGDIRFQYLAEMFANNGNIVKILGHDNYLGESSNTVICNDIVDITQNVDIAILGIPAIKNDIIYTPLSDKTYFLDDFFLQHQSGYTSIHRENDRLNKRTI